MLNSRDHKQAENETTFTANKRGFRPTLSATSPQTAAYRNCQTLGVPQQSRGLTLGSQMVPYIHSVCGRGVATGTMVIGGAIRDKGALWLGHSDSPSPDSRDLV
jgi:hypothetical protein